MKKQFFSKTVFMAFVLIAGLAACSDDDKEDSPTPVAAASTSDPCTTGDGFCMNYGGTVKSGAAKLTVQSSNNKIRVYWDNGSGSNFEQVELDIFSLTAGTFPVNMTNASNTAFLQYFSSAGGAVNPAYGTLTVSSLDTIAGVTGTFTVTMQDSTKITGGKFTNIKK